MDPELKEANVTFENKGNTQFVGNETVNPHPFNNKTGCSFDDLLWIHFSYNQGFWGVIKSCVIFDHIKIIYHLTVLLTRNSWFKKKCLWSYLQIVHTLKVPSLSTVYHGKILAYWTVESMTGIVNLTRNLQRVSVPWCRADKIQC